MSIFDQIREKKGVPVAESEETALPTAVEEKEELVETKSKDLETAETTDDMSERESLLEEAVAEEVASMAEDKEDSLNAKVMEEALTEIATPKPEGTADDEAPEVTDTAGVGSDISDTVPDVTDTGGSTTVLDKSGVDDTDSPIPSTDSDEVDDHDKEPEKTEVKAKSGRIIVTRQYKKSGEKVTEDDTSEELIEVETFNTTPAHVSMSMGTTINLGDYNSCKVDIHVSIPCYKEEIENAHDYLKNYLTGRIEGEIFDIKTKMKK